MSWRVTLRCTRAEAEALPESADLFVHADEPPVIVADEPDPPRPDDWRIHAYFAEQPTTQELVLLRRLASDREPEVEHLEDTTDWVTMSQSGLGPIRAGRFFVHTPMHYADRPADTDQFRDRRRTRLRHRPARYDGRLPRGARPAGARGQALRQHRRHRHRHRPARLRRHGAVARCKSDRHRHRRDRGQGQRGKCGDQRRQARPWPRASYCSRSPTAWIIR